VPVVVDAAVSLPAVPNEIAQITLPFVPTAVRLTERIVIDVVKVPAM
jgi:hypothetical protein